MRIAFLCKRRYTGHNLISDRYGRLYEMPYQLARMGHAVHGFCLDYYPSTNGEWTHDAAPGTLHWTSVSLEKNKLPTLAIYPSRLLERLREFSPDVIIGASDIPQCVLAARLAQKLGVPCVLDLYDNFEGFGQAKIPGFVPALRLAVRHADLLITVTERLRDYVMDNYSLHAEVLVMGNSLDKTTFHPVDATEARKALGLPYDAKLIGTAGGLCHSKGIGVLCDAWALIAAQRPDFQLVLAGPIESGFRLPRGERVHYLGNLPYTRVPQVFNALDLGVVSVLDTAFGRYCHPQKAYEMLACGLPMVAADVGATGDLFADTPEALFRAGDAESLAEVILRRLDQPRAMTREIPDWRQLVESIEPALRSLSKC